MYGLNNFSIQNKVNFILFYFIVNYYKLQLTSYKLQIIIY
jgi:hypothetical protein